MGYSAMDSGLALSPRGIGAIMAIFFVGRVIGRLDSRILICCGFITLAAVSYQLSGLDLQMSIANIVVPNIIMGLAMGLIFVPLTTLTMGGLPNEQMGNAAGIFNLMRNLGGSIGISVVTTLLARNAQQHQVFIAAHFNPYNPQFQQYAQKLSSLFALKGPPDYLDHKALLALYYLAVQQASLLAYMDSFRLLAFVCLLCVPAVLMLKGLRGGHSGLSRVH